MPDIIPIGNANARHTIIVINEPINAPKIPAFSGSRESDLRNKDLLKNFFTLLFSFSQSSNLA